MTDRVDVIVVGSGNAALCAAIAALNVGARVLVLEKADEKLAGGNSKYTAGAMRFVYEGKDDLLPLLSDPDDEKIEKTDFGAYTSNKFREDLLGFNEGRPLSEEQNDLIENSYETIRWLSDNGLTFEPIYSRQSFEKEGRHVFWGGLTLATAGEGVGLVDRELEIFLKKGGSIRYSCEVVDLLVEENRVCGVVIQTPNGKTESLRCTAVVLGSGGFEANAELRRHYIGPNWEQSKVRGTPHNTGQGLQMALELGAQEYGFFEGCHATPMDLHMKDFGNLDIPHLERKNYRKICYFLGIMLNANGERFVDEGVNFRNYTYAQFGRAILEQPKHLAWQIFDKKTEDLLYAEYRFEDAHFVEADTLEELVEKLDGIDDKAQALKTIVDFNKAVDHQVAFDPTIKDGKGTEGLAIPKTNWAQTFDKPPYKAFPVTCGITFTYGGLKVDKSGCVLRKDNTQIEGLYACGELVGGVFFNGYPGGSGLTSGAVFGRRAGIGAAHYAGA